MKKFFSTRYSEFSFNLSMFLVRLGFGGFLFLNHGLIKLNRFSELKNSFSDPFHVGHTTSLMLALFAEVFCSILLVMGLLTRLASFVLVILFLTIIFIIQKHKPLQDSELAILYLMASITTLFCGPGKWSLDRLIGK
ncbi:MAG TPA: DoxX family protein [Chitinophagaceae bacterium]|jgi:putative oxidoreductase|nr:DoxX family protein [Chitinophagaceae bacterium]